MSKAKCSVVSPCGRYRVHFETNGKDAFVVEVCGNTNKGSALVASPALAGGGVSSEHVQGTPCRFSATLNEAQVRELTTAAGVRKSFQNFCEMVYNALIGNATCVRFYVESCEEMKRRIAADVRRQQRGGGTSQYTEEADGGHGRDDGSVIDLSMSSDVAEEILAQRFLTIDYDVDFTRAIFPIPLDPVSDETRRQQQQQLLQRCSNGPSATANAVGDLSIDEDSELAEAARVIARLRAENAQLRDENAALVQLSKEKMLEMQRLCEDFQARVQVGAEAERLRRKNAELRVRLQEAKEAQAAAERSLEAERIASRRRSRQTVSRASTPDERRLRGRSAETHGTSPNPYLRSLSRYSTGSVPSRAPSVASDTGSTRSRRSANTLGGGSQGRGTDRASVTRGRAAAASRERRPLVSPTPPPSQSRRSRSRPTGNRFDTPPPRETSTHSPSQRRAQVPARRSPSFPIRAARVSEVPPHNGGGDSPAPRGRSGNRVLEDYPFTTKTSRASHGGRGEGGGGYSSDEGGSSRASSRAPSVSSASHDRLYHASTAASRSRQQPHTASIFDTPPRRAVFR